MKSQKWYLQFSNYLKNFEEEYNQSRSELSPIAYALKNGKIPYQDYIKWAQKTYNLPYVKDDYFKSQLPPTDEWKDWKSEYKWSSEIIPLGLWDGHLLIACLEIPLQFPVSLHPVFVLADLHNIEKTYHYYLNSEKGTSTAKEKIKDTTPVSSQKPSSPKEETAQSFELLDLTDTPEEEILVITEPEETPEGLSLEVKPQKLKVVEDSPFNIFEDQSPSAKIDNAVSNPSIKQDDSSSIKTKSEIDISTSLHLPDKVQEDINKGMPYLVSLKKENTQYFESFTQEIFSKNKNVYDKMILFSIDPSESFTVPVSWTDSITPRSKNIESISLAEPSVFKIVCSTIKSYHGYVVLNEINEKFFDFWNLGQVPGNITMCPIIVKNKIVGFLMGLGEPNAYNWGTLKKMESITTETIAFFNDFFEHAKAS